jgi:hypothetical protein
MSTITSLRRAGGALVASAVALSLVGAGGAAQAAPAASGAHWLSSQLTGGLLVGHFTDDTGRHAFNDYGPTIDTALGLQAIGGHRGTVVEIRHALAQPAHAREYIGAGQEKYAGPTAKLLVFAQTTGADPTDFGGINLVSRLNGRVNKKGPAVGRIADQSAFGDFANTVGQILAVRGLTAAKSGQAGHAQTFLLKQQCRQGYFRLDFSKPGSAHQSCGKKSLADPDTTAYAVVQLWKASRGDSRLRGALNDAIAWLARQQHKNGSFVGGTTTAYPNTNTTGLSAWALAVTGRCSAAKKAAGWIGDLQVGAQKAGSALAGERGAVAYRSSSLKLALKQGITDDTQDEWWRATSQAVPALQFRHGC